MKCTRVCLMTLMNPSASRAAPPAGLASHAARVRSGTTSGSSSSSSSSSPCCSSCANRACHVFKVSPLQRGRRRSGLAAGSLTRAAVGSGSGGGGRRSKSGPSNSYRETWDGSKYDIGVMGMWDGLDMEGPSCIRLPPLEQCTVEDLEAAYVQAKNTYFSGQPLMDDEKFDQIEKRLVRAPPRRLSLRLAVDRSRLSLFQS